MLDIKNNYRGKYENNLCRLCKVENETQEHVLNECPKIHTDKKSKVYKQDIFHEDTIHLKEISTRINNAVNKLTSNL